MAGDWIPMRLDLYEDPAVIQMAEIMEVREEVVVGYLHKVWSWMSRQCHADVTLGVTLESLGRVTHLPGFPEIMSRVGWLEETDGGIRIPNFERWLSQSAKQRVLATNRKRAQRLQDVAKMSRSQRDENGTREEKRREEKKKRKPPTPFCACDVQFPKSIDTPACHAVWSDWVRHRSQIRHPVTEAMAEKQLLKMAAMGADRMIAAINHTIAMGWQGLREPEKDSNGRMATKPKESTHI